MLVSVITPIKHLNLHESQLNLYYSVYLRDETYYDHFKLNSSTAILDYSPVLPRSVDLLDYGYWIARLKPRLVILPSVDFSADKTVALSKSLLSQVRIGQPVGVIQGFDLDSLYSCYLSLRSYCKLLALPSPLEKVARREEIVRDLGLREEFLYLEVYRNPYEEVPPKSAVGICTSFPLRLAQDLRRLSEFELGARIPPPLDFPRRELVEELAKDNIQEYLRVVGEE